MPISATFLPDFAMRGTSAAVSASSIWSGRDLLRQVMHRVELRDRLLVGVVVALRRQRPLADIDDEEGGVEAAFDHLRQVDLRLEALRVVLLPREVVGIDVVVGVERDHAIVNGARLLDERLVGGAGLAQRAVAKPPGCGPGEPGANGAADRPTPVFSDT